MTVGLHNPVPQHHDRDRDVVHRKRIESYQQRLAQAERDFIAALDKLNADYLHILEVGGSAYAAAIERGRHVYDSIEQPARARYEREQEIADSAYQGIVEPAGKELDRLTRAAHDLYDRAIRPIENAYNAILNEAGALTSSSNLGSPAP